MDCTIGRSAKGSFALWRLPDWLAVTTIWFAQLFLHCPHPQFHEQKSGWQSNQAQNPDESASAGARQPDSSFGQYRKTQQK